MAWPDESDDYLPRLWHSQLRQERLDLSLSVEATLADKTSDELDQTGGLVPISRSATIIPPRLTLKSKALAVVHPGAFIQTASHLPVPATTVEAKSATRNTNLLARLAMHITSSLSALKIGTQPVPVVQPPPLSSDTEQTHSVPTIYESSLAMPIVRVDITSVEPAAPKVIEAITSARSITLAQPAMRAVTVNRRLAGKSTKVHLEAAPKLEVMPGGRIDMNMQMGKRTTHSENVIEGRIGTTKSGALSGSGEFLRSQSEISITNTNITATSVVVVTLTGDPGPVVVQYVSLRAHDGFTIHLSAPTGTKTPFNYVILMGELF